MIRGWAAKIGAEFREITDRKFPHLPVTAEKLQIYDLARQDRAEWAIYIDADTLVSPEFFDITDHLTKDTVCHNAADMAGVRWRYDQYFRRDGRHIGSGNWFAVASEWCLDLWHPLDDLTLDEALDNIHVTIAEKNLGMQREHLIDDYVLSRNIARYGLKFTTVHSICTKLSVYSMMWHDYMATEEEKLRMMLNILASPFGVELKHPNKPKDHAPYGVGWALMVRDNADALADRWEIPPAWRQWNSPVSS